MALLCYMQHFALSKIVSQVFATILFTVNTFLLILIFVALDAVRDNFLYRRILLYSASFFVFLSYFVMFRFWRDIFLEEVQDILKQTVEIGIFRIFSEEVQGILKQTVEIGDISGRAGRTPSRAVYQFVLLLV